MKDLKEIAKNSKDSYDYAESLHFKNVPYIIIESISKDTIYSYDYAESLHFKNVPYIIIESISKDTIYSYWYVKHLNYTNVPLMIVKSAINYYYFTDNIKNFPVNKRLLCYMLQYDKRMNIII